MSTGEHKGTMLHRVEEEVSEEIHPLLKKIQDNIKRIGLILGAVVLLAAGVSGYKYYKTSSLESARSTMSRIVAQQEGQAAIDSLEGFLGEAPGELKQAVRLELARLSMDQELFDKAAAYWSQAAGKAADQNIRTVASLGQAKALRFQGQPEKSLSLLESLASEAPGEYERTIHYEIAVAAEAAGDWQRALSAYEQLQAKADLTGKRGNFIDYKISMLEDMVAAGNS